MDAVTREEKRERLKRLSGLCKECWRHGLGILDLRPDADLQSLLFRLSAIERETDEELLGLGLPEEAEKPAFTDVTVPPEKTA